MGKERFAVTNHKRSSLCHNNRIAIYFRYGANKSDKICNKQQNKDH